jgi:hypothetical protein
VFEVPFAGPDDGSGEAAVVKEEKKGGSGKGSSSSSKQHRASASVASAVSSVAGDAGGAAGAAVPEAKSEPTLVSALVNISDPVRLSWLSSQAVCLGFRMLLD